MDLTSKQIVNLEIRDFLNSDFYQTATAGKRYYKNQNDIINKKRYSIVNGVKSVDNSVENNIISHPIFRDLVDQKINYLLGNDWNTDNEILNEIFNDDFRVSLEMATRDAITCGVGWLFALPNNTFQYVNSLEVVPLWREPEHINLDGVIKLYSRYEYEGLNKTIVNYAEYWTLEGVETFREIGGTYTRVIGEEIQPHLDNAQNWNVIPFIPIKYNQDETSLLTLVKSIIDKIDLTASNTQDLLTDLTNKTNVLSGAEGTDLKEFALNKRLYRTISLPEDAEFSEVGTEPNISSAVEWINELRREAYICGQGYDPLQVIGANASGEARRNLYTALDLDSNRLESGILKALKLCIWFINNSPNNKFNILEDVKIRFTRNIMISQKEQLENAMLAQSLIGVSTKTSLGISGIVENIPEEIKRWKEEQEEGF